MPKNISKAKQTRNFLKSGGLKGQIDARHKRKAFEAKKKGRDAKRNKGVLPAHQQRQSREDESDEEWEKVKEGKKAKKEEEDQEEEDDEELDLDQVLGGEGLDSEGEGEGEDGSDLEDDDLSNLSDDDASSNASAGQHMADLRALAEKDPDFFKYLQENDAELLDFDEDAPMDGAAEDDDEDDEDDEDEEEEDLKSKKKGKGKEVQRKKANVLTKELLRSWQKSILETRSLRSFRKLLHAFRSAASSGGGVGGANDDADESGAERYEIQSPAVFQKVVVTALKYTPVVLQSYVPYKEANGKYKLSTNSKQYAVAQRLIKSFFVSLQGLLDSLPRESDIPTLAVSESAKLVPWIVGNRKVARGWVKMLLSQYDSATDETRVAAFLALRKLAVAADHSLRESVLKGVYATFLGSARQTSVYTLPAITLMKNSASELFLLPGKQEVELSYQLAFSYIRQLAILLRKGVKDASKEAYKSVYNWQFVHAVDFWSIVLAGAGDKQRVAENGESPLQQLLYPLIQVALGAIRLVPTSRYFPLRFQILRSLLRLVQRTGVYIPLSAPLFELLDSPELTKRSKPSTLKPLDWDYHLKCPTSYQRTRVYADAIVDEAVFLLAEYYAALSTSIAFPELVLPAVVALKRTAKRAATSGTQARLASVLKQLVEKLDASSKWVEVRREKVEFAPGKRDKVERFLKDEDAAKTPLGTHVKLLRKQRDAKKATMERAVHQAEDI
ncbi:hypothetical protein JCM8097_001647 [Rhodosporidiobolus ruineniae]